MLVHVWNICGSVSFVLQERFEEEMAAAGRLSYSPDSIMMKRT